jgi:hypothetical protein
VSYNASVVDIYNATGSLVRFENKGYFLLIVSVLAYVHIETLALYVVVNLCRSRRIGSRSHKWWALTLLWTRFAAAAAAAAAAIDDSGYWLLAAAAVNVCCCSSFRCKPTFEAAEK